MQVDEKKFDFHSLGLAIKQAREERGWTQAYLAELVGRTDRTIMNIENKGQHPSLNTSARWPSGGGGRKQSHSRRPPRTGR